MADVLGDDFGTPFRNLLLDPNEDDLIRKQDLEDYNGYRLRDRDRERLAAAGYDPDARFYHSTPGGAGSAAIQPVNRPAPTLIRTTAHDLPSTYRPVENDPVDLRQLYHPTFYEFSRIGGFPDDWKWPAIASEVEGPVDEEEFLARSRQRLLMLANAVPPPMAHAIGRAIVDHHERKPPVAAVEERAVKDAAWRYRGKAFARYVKWLHVAKRYEGQRLIQELSDLKKATSLVASNRLESARDELAAFDAHPATRPPHMKPTRRSQLRGTLRRVVEFETYLSNVIVDRGDVHDKAYAEGELKQVLTFEHMLGEPIDDERVRSPKPLRLLRTAAQRSSSPEAVAPTE